MDLIRIRGARQHNLKNISLDIPRNQLVVITGVSGSGKSSLAFDTLYAEGRRRYVESLSAYARQFLDQRAKPDVDAIEGLSPAIAIEQRGTTTSPRSTVATVTEIANYLRLLYARVGIAYCPTCGRPIVQHSVPQIVDRILDLPEGSRIQVLAPIRLHQATDYTMALRKLREAGFVRVRIDGTLYDLTEEHTLPRKATVVDLVVDRLIVKSGIARRLADSVETALRYGDDVVKVAIGDTEERLFTQKLVCPICGFAYPELTPTFFSPNSPEGACPACDGLGTQSNSKPTKRSKARALDADEAAEALERVSIAPSPALTLSPSPVSTGEGSAERRVRAAFSDTQLKTALAPCSECGGTRLRKETRGVRIQERDITQVLALSIIDAYTFFSELSLTGQRGQVAQPLCEEIVTRLRFLLDIGLDYLTLDRPAMTLSGGEAQRIRLATQLGASLSGVLYVLDEPSIGLHPRDTVRLLAALRQLRDRGNTVVMVEHDRETIMAADYVVDLGPGAGERGGALLAYGTPQEIMQSAASLTGQYLRGALSIPVPAQRRQATHWLTITDVSLHNLKGVTAAFPLGTLIGVTGVSGSGKSTLVMDVLYPALVRLLAGKSPHLPFGKGGQREARGDFRLAGHVSGWQPLEKIISVDQTSISRTTHSNPATYVGLFNPLRDLYAQLPEARVRGYGPERFSFNVKGGRCEACEGDGVVAMEMHFLPDLYVICDVCHGARYNRETLEVTFRGKNIAQVLNLTVNEALEVLGDIPGIRPRLETLRDVGLDYLRLGQPMPTLSGGEAQRLKLARELSRRTSGHTLYILDEPTTGLHFADIQRLLNVLGMLVEAGNTVLVIEHNLDVIKTVDFVIDLGPEGGDQGGHIVATGTPEDVAQVEQSHTGRLLRSLLMPPINLALAGLHG